MADDDKDLERRELQAEIVRLKLAKLEVLEKEIELREQIGRAHV